MPQSGSVLNGVNPNWKVDTSKLPRQYITKKGNFLNMFCWLVSGPSCFNFYNHVHKGRLGTNKKKQVKLLKVFLITLFDIIFKRVSSCNGCFELLTKIEKGSATSCWCFYILDGSYLPVSIYNLKFINWLVSFFIRTTSLLKISYNMCF